ncbi:MAG: hypothetical protein GXY83_07400 [Rhodopirellula sp.]|nr:hypothetical protein [Rhodopirellula sp.]
MPTREEIQSATTAAVSDIGSAGALVGIARKGTDPLELISGKPDSKEIESACRFARRLGATLESSGEKIKAVSHVFTQHAEAYGENLIARTRHEAMLRLAEGVWEIISNYCGTVDPEINEETIDGSEFQKYWPVIKKRLALKYGDVNPELIANGVIAEKDEAVKRFSEPAFGSGTSEIPDPDPELVVKLRGLSRELLLYMWKRGPVTRDELRPLWTKLGREEPTDKAIEDAIDYLNESLKLRLHLKETKVEKNGGLYYLKHPQK